MVTANNYELDIFNGDVGIVRRKSKADGPLMVYFQSTDPMKPKEILPGYLSDYETVFAMTIHKSQGSEFESVCVILPENEKTRILTRELLYTAVSRAKNNVTVQSRQEVITETISREVNRASGINNQF
jgi:exodeoxyribonuclease V alpha subunit